MTRAFDFAYAALEPTCIAILCTIAVHTKARHAGWVVSLLLISVMLNVVTRPNKLILSLVAITLGVVAMLGSFYKRERVTMLGSISCCALIATSLLLAQTNE